MKPKCAQNVGIVPSTFVLRPKIRGKKCGKSGWGRKIIECRLSAHSVNMTDKYSLEHEHIPSGYNRQQEYVFKRCVNHYLYFSFFKMDFSSQSVHIVEKKLVETPVGNLIIIFIFKVFSMIPQKIKYSVPPFVLVISESTLFLG